MLSGDLGSEITDFTLLVCCNNFVSMFLCLPTSSPINLGDRGIYNLIFTFDFYLFFFWMEEA